MKNIKLFLIVISFALMGSGFDLLLVAGAPDVPYDRVKAEFHIYNKAHLESVAVAVNDPNNWWKSLGETFKLEADIATFTNTIGTASSPFMGRFEGSGYRIKVNINKPTADMVGLFGRLIMLW